MSPLVCSLLALAALLAAADAQQYYDCVTKIIGRTSSHEKELVSVDIPYGESYLEVKDYCDPPMHLVGEKVTVCNKSPQWTHADITPPQYPELSPVRIYCHDHLTECKAFTTEYCDY